MRKTYILTHSPDGQKLYEARVLQITPSHAANLRAKGMTLEEEGSDGELDD